MWSAVTSVERIPRWFLRVTGELRAGGGYQLGFSDVHGSATSSVAYCHDNADHLTATNVTTRPTAGDSGYTALSSATLPYDAHGNTTKLDT